MPFGSSVAEPGLYDDQCFVEVRVGEYNLHAVSFCLPFECKEKLCNNFRDCCSVLLNVYLGKVYQVLVKADI